MASAPLTGIQGTNTPNVVIQEGASINGFQSVDANCVFGAVKVVFPGCTTCAVGANVFYDKTNARRLVKGGVNYFSVSEKDILFIETPDPIVG